MTSAAASPLLLAVLGGDVSRSLSPRIHARAAEATGIAVHYLAVSAVTPLAFAERVAALRTLGARGANVTIPHKRVALALADRLTEEARAIGAVNTLVFEAGRVEGHNTDGPGLVRCLAGRDLEVVRVLGAGGAARAAVWAAQAAGAGRVEVAARRPNEASGLGVRAVALEADAGEPPTTVISTLPESAAEAGWGGFEPKRRPFVLDLAYAGLDASPALVERARAEGLEAEDGLGLLAEQGALSFARWTQGPLEAARAAMRAALKR